MEDLARLIRGAICNETRALFQRLERGSRLPGTRPNLDFAEKFASQLASFGKEGMDLAVAMATLHADAAPGGTAHEFLPMCGVLAVGALAACTQDAKVRARLIGVLHDAAEDLRFRVRDVVPIALARIGARDESLVATVSAWMDGYFHAAAVLRALARAEWLCVLEEPSEPAERLREAFALLSGAPRAAERYPGFKALADAIDLCGPALALRFGAPIFDVLLAYASNKEPIVRDLLQRLIRDKKLKGRFSSDLDRVARALAASAPPVRDPRSNVGPTRRRGQR